MSDYFHMNSPPRTPTLSYSSLSSLDTSLNESNSSKIIYSAIGSCEYGKRDSHSYLTCDNCIVFSKLCDFPSCPCEGIGEVFLINDEKRLWAHEIPGHLFSVRAYSNRPTRFRTTVQASIKKFSKKLHKGKLL